MAHNAIYAPNVPGSTDDLSLDGKAAPASPKTAVPYTEGLSGAVLGLFSVTVGTTTSGDKPAAGEAKIVKITRLGSPSPHFVGGYGAFREINDSDKAVLDTVLKKFAGAKYTANLVSTQVVAGTNYRFAGTQTPSTEDAPAYPALLTVYQPLSGKPVITGVERVYELV